MLTFSKKNIFVRQTNVEPDSRCYFPGYLMKLSVIRLNLQQREEESRFRVEVHDIENKRLTIFDILVDIQSMDVLYNIKSVATS